jgi:hypothetical protein
MKVLVVKGWVGFGDRLETLQMCIKYALQVGRVLYVDWSDSIWSHGSESFASYFRLTNVPQTDVCPTEGTVYPSVWEGRLDQPMTAEFALAHREALCVDIHKGVDYPHTILVCSSIGMRTLYPDSRWMANHFRVSDPRIIQRVRQRRAHYKLDSALGIHLRGTDRASSFAYKLNRVREMGSRLVGMGVFSSGQNMIVCSDDPEYIQMWKARFPDARILTERGSLGGRAGVHTQQTIPCSKDELNVDMLVDFFTLACCARVLSSSADSRFANEAIRLHPIVDQLLENGSI